MMYFAELFPDKKGIASGLTIAGFGSGALVFTPLAQTLMKKFAVMPQYLGAAENFVTEVILFYCQYNLFYHLNIPFEIDILKYCIFFYSSLMGSFKVVNYSQR